MKRSRGSSSGGRPVSGTSSAPHQCTSSAEVIATSDDILTIILIRLPVKPLHKFKSVSKHWLSLISSPHFSRSRNPNSSISGLFLPDPNDPQIIHFVPLRDDESRFLPPSISYSFIDPWTFNYDESDLLARYKSLNFVDQYQWCLHDDECLHHYDDSVLLAPYKSLNFIEPRSVYIVQACNGLLCCSGYDYFELNYYICNPTTDQFTILPQLAGGEYVYGMCLAFDPSVSSHYKVVCVGSCNSSLEHSYQIQIYSSESRFWRVSGDPFSVDGYRDFLDGVFCNGAIHFLPNIEKSRANSKHANALCFDIAQERLQKMLMPPIPSGMDARKVLYVGESRNHLHFVEVYDSNNKLFNIYEMERDNSGWFLKHRGYLNVFQPAFDILCFVRGESEEESFLVVHLPGKAVSYNLKGNKIKDLCEFSSSTSIGESRCHQYLESISPV